MFRPTARHPPTNGGKERGETAQSASREIEFFASLCWIVLDRCCCALLCTHDMEHFDVLKVLEFGAAGISGLFVDHLFLFELFSIRSIPLDDPDPEMASNTWVFRWSALSARADVRGASRKQKTKEKSC
jgi:hypothetical protein